MKLPRFGSHNVAVLISADEGLLEVIKAVLVEEAHVRVVTVPTPELVLSLLEATAPAVILLDMNLPERGGWDILTTLRQDARFQSLPVLLLLSAALEDDAQAAAQRDPQIALIQMPFDLEALLQRVQYLAQQPAGDEKGT